MFRYTIARVKPRRWLFLGALALALVCILISVGAQEGAQNVGDGGPSISGRLVDPLGEPIHDANVAVRANGASEPVAHTESQEDGSFLLALPAEIDVIEVKIELFIEQDVLRQNRFATHN